jgi:hypothetical protein
VATGLLDETLRADARRREEPEAWASCNLALSSGMERRSSEM